MTVLEAIHRLDDLEPNVLPQEAKMRWLSELDGLVWRSVICTHVPGPGEPRERKGNGSTAHTQAAGSGGIRPATPIGAEWGTAEDGGTTESTGTAGGTFPGYGPETAGDTVLLIPAPYDAAYPHFLAAKINFVNGEAERYNAETALLNDLLSAFEADYNRTHRAVKWGRFRF